MRLLELVLDQIRDRRLRVVNCDLTLIAEEPKLGPYRTAIRSRVAAVLGISVESVGLKATTHEGLGAIGRGEGMAALAVVLLERED